MAISIKSDREIELMTIAGNIVYETHKYLKEYLKPGITTKRLDTLAEDFIISKGAIPSCKGFEGYPATLCTSINEEVVHGIPSNRKLKNGDIITLDICACYKGYHGDSAWTYAIGDISCDKEYLLEHTEKSLYEGLKQVKPGNRIGDISSAIEEYAKKHKLGVIKELEGHGIGRQMHEEPEVPNYGKAGKGARLVPGMTIAVEPMVIMGKPDIYQLDDGWTIVTEDGSLSAHYENTILITEKEPEILTI
jgi:methionyl aminopeptidase